MKKITLLLLVLFLSIHLFAQNGISFQGIARDVMGNAIMNKTISVKFTIGSFIEEQELKTDEFGVFSATIGSVNQTGFNNLVFTNNNDNLKVEVDGTIIYNDKFNTVPYAKAADNGVPPGCIMPFAGPVDKIPAGWLLCDGSPKAKTGVYQKLYEAIGSHWGAEGDNFKLPDLRGMFLRGTNENREDGWKDPESRPVGSFQEDAFGDHNHTATIANAGAHTHAIVVRPHVTEDVKNPFASSRGTNVAQVPEKYQHTDSNGDHSHSATIGSTGGDETRPNNAAVVYIIKY
jgi:microcystin-dependent protein